MLDRSALPRRRADGTHGAQKRSPDALRLRATMDTPHENNLVQPSGLDGIGDAVRYGPKTLWTGTGASAGRSRNHPAAWRPTQHGTWCTA
eukprot:gene3230-biopygen9545